MVGDNHALKLFRSEQPRTGLQVSRNYLSIWVFEQIAHFGNIFIDECHLVAFV